MIRWRCTEAGACSLRRMYDIIQAEESGRETGLSTRMKQSYPCRCMALTRASMLPLNFYFKSVRKSCSSMRRSKARLSSLTRSM
jgi:hypothetical protein